MKYPLIVYHWFAAIRKSAAVRLLIFGSVSMSEYGREEKNMSKSTSAVKRKYNKDTYVRHEFSVRMDTLLSEKIIEYKETDSLSELVKELLAGHFGVSAEEM
jgi:hypothetical protein